MRRSVEPESGQTTVLVIGLSLVVFAVAGVAMDLGNVYLMKRSLQQHADQTVAAVEVALTRDQVRPDPHGLAEKWLADSNVRADVQVAVRHDVMLVRLTTSVRTTLLGFIGLDEVAVTAEARAAIEP